MIIITGDLLIKDGSMQQAMQACQKHVAHSRTELGCISHSVYQDPENVLRLFFYEHFVLPSSLAFVAAVTTLVSAPPNLHIFNATQIE
jgi:quinol monooxygenase YgiN